ncbi:MAG: proline dehydrogenase family protein, partial [Actinomycetota bacterium]|nr:proline dehydrogenase family protein [Actinomycetota bacterium]
MSANNPLEAEIRRVGAELAAAFPSSARHPVKALDARAMELAAGDDEVRAALFRFVDVVPACRGVDDLARHLTGFLDEIPDSRPPIAAALKMADTRAGRAALGASAAAGVKHMSYRFIVGETPETAVTVLRRLWSRGVASSVDLLGEATITESEADAYAERCLGALRSLAVATAGWPERPALEHDASGALPRANVSVKVSALTPLLRPDAPELGERDGARRLRPLLREAKARGAHVHIDMESLDSREAVLELVLALLAEEEFRHGPSTGIVLQAYMRDSPDQLDQILEWASAQRHTPPPVIRLVKGAYWDHEIAEAGQHGWPAPVFEVKADCDR